MADALPCWQVDDCNMAASQDWYVDTQGRLHPLHAPQLCLDVVAGRSAVTTCSTAATQVFVGLGEHRSVLIEPSLVPKPILFRTASHKNVVDIGLLRGLDSISCVLCFCITGL
jgi:hypothetical protein